MKRLTVLFCVLTLLGMHLRAQSVADIEGNIYTIVQIGRQYWLQENLRVTQFGDGSPIETTNPASLNICTEKSPLYQWAYDDNLNNVAAYGRLYTWYTIADSRKLCPLGWHVPNNADWNTLSTFLGGPSTAGGPLKEAGTAHWQTPNTGATNSTGFSAVLGGHRMCTGGFMSLNSNAFYWSSTPNGTDYGWSWKLFYADPYLQSDSVYGYKNYGFSIRCISDTLATSLPEPKSDAYLHCSPNPATEEFVVDADLGDDMVLNILDVTGATVLVQPLKRGTAILDISGLASGVYLVIVSGSNGVLQRRLMVE